MFERRDRVSSRINRYDRRRYEKRDAWKRDLSGRANGTIDPYYGCDLYDEMIDYAVNFTIPWSEFLAINILDVLS
jgi:carboxypeptidase D